jgi:uncharacterized membrane protein
VIVNSEAIVEEILRTVIGSLALILAVPVSTLVAAYVYDKRDPGDEKGHTHAHAHHHHH